MAKRDLAAELLRELGQDRTQYHSGEELSVRLGVSRTAVWKAACRLREQGYAIESVTRLGYRLTALPDGMTKELLEQYLPQGRGETVICYEETDSTNTRGMQLALEGAPTGTVVLADRQTHGNGRLGRSFASPAGQGVYLSYLLRPDFDPAALSLLAPGWLSARCWSNMAWPLPSSGPMISSLTAARSAASSPSSPAMPKAAPSMARSSASASAIRRCCAACCPSESYCGR